MIKISCTQIATLTFVVPPGTEGVLQRAIFTPGTTWAELQVRVPTPSLTNAPFKHWSLTCNGDPIAPGQKFEASTTIYGVFDGTVVVTAQTGTEPAQFQIPVVPGTTIRKVIDELPKIKKADYSFVCWSLDGTNAVDPLHRITEATTLNAVWVDISNTIEITFATGDLFQPMEPLRVTPGTQWTAIAGSIRYPTPAANNCVFKNWSRSAGGAAIEAGALFNENTTIYAVGERASEFINITFNSQGGSGVNPLINQPKGILYGYVRQLIDDPVRHSDADRFDWFAGWAEAPLADAELDPSYAFQQTTTLYAQWVTRIDVTIKNNGPDRVVSKEANYWPYSELLGEIECEQEHIPEKHTFKHWSLTADGPDMGTEGKIGADTNVYAVYEPYAVITPDMQGGAGSSAVEVPAGTTWAEVKEKVTAPTLDEYEFKHWSLTVDGEAIDDEHQFEGSVTIYAVWAPLFTVITPDMQGGTGSEAVKVAINSTWATVKDQITAPTLAENTFKHWSLTLGGEAISDEYAFTTGEATIYAVWIPYATIVIDSKGGSEQASFKVPGNTTWTEAKGQVTTPTKEENTFSHWSLTDGGAVIEEGYEFAPGSTTTIYAVWTPYAVITPDMQGGTGSAEVKVPSGTTWATVKGMLTAPTLSENTFKHWSLNPGGAVIEDTHAFTGATTIYAVYDPYAVITPDMQGGAGSSVVKVPINTTWATVKSMLTEPTLADNEFKHWSLTQGGGAIDEGHQFAGEVTIYAVWTPYAVITPDMQGGTGSTVVKVPDGTTWATVKGMLTEPTLADNEFKHWSLSVGGEAIEEDHAFSGAVTIYAVWIPYVELTFSTGGGSEVDAIKVPSGSTWGDVKARVGTTTRDEYTFAHWSLTDSGVVVPDEHQFTSATTIYAVWTALYATITPDMQGGTGSAPVKVSVGATWATVKSQFTEPTLAENTFKHWSLTVGGEVIPEEHVFNEATTIYAVWTPYVELTFVTGGGSAVSAIKVPSGSQWSAIKGQVGETSQEGYRFDRWSLSDGGEVVPETTAFTAASTPIYAVFIKTWVVTFDANGGSPQHEPITVDDGTTWGQIKDQVENPTKEDYEFLGWSVVS